MFTIDEIMQLMDKLHQTGLQELDIKQGDFGLTIKAKEAAAVVAAPAAAPQVVYEQALQVQEASEPAETGEVVTSPIVGTFYAAVSPDKPPYVSVGSTVNKGDTVCIIESMKIMNEIQSEFSGTVKKILVENGQMVEYGQPLMVIE